jgi:hypothetical protein
MIKDKPVLILIFFLIYFHNSGLAQKFDNIKDDKISIDSIFYNLEQQSGLNNQCRIEFKNVTEPDVDLWDTNYILIVSQIEKSKVLQLVDCYVRFCNTCDSNTVKNTLLGKMDLFLTSDMYSIELHYKLKQGKVEDLLSLIYFKEGYILFSMRIKKD